MKLNEINIKQKSGQPAEILTSEQIDIIATLAQSSDINSSLTGVIRSQTGKCYDDSYRIIMDKLYSGDWNLTFNPDINESNRYIRFQDPKVEYRLLHASDYNGIYGAASLGDGNGITISDITTWKNNNGSFTESIGEGNATFHGSDIEYFNEFQYFTNITSANSWYGLDPTGRKGGFAYCTNLKEITLPPSLIHIQGNIFNSSGLEKCDMRLCTKIVTNETNAYSFGLFAGAKYLKEVLLPENMKEIPCGFFSGATSYNQELDLTNIEKIWLSAFRRCENLENIHISNECKQIGSGAFYQCYKLTGENIDLSGCQIIENEAFRQCFAFKVNDTLDLSNCTTVGQYAFMDSGVNKIIFSDKLNSLGERFATGSPVTEIQGTPQGIVFPAHCFQQCKKLVNVNNGYFPGIEIIPDCCFYECLALNCELNFPDLKTMGAGVFHKCQSLKKVLSLGKITTIPDGTSSFGYAFNSCTSLTDINLPDTLLYIGSEAFNYCSSLKYVKIPNSVTGFGNNAFSNCTNLLYMYVPEGVTTIGGQAFVYMCRNLKYISIPSTVSTITPYTFDGCYALLGIILYGDTVKEIQHVNSIGNSGQRKIYVKASLVDQYKTADIWKNYADYIFPIGGTVWQQQFGSSDDYAWIDYVNRTNTEGITITKD